MPDWVENNVKIIGEEESISTSKTILHHFEKQMET